MIYQLTSDHLTTTPDEFDFHNPPINPIELANNLIETMVANRGIGLSATQCGLPYRVFVMHSSPTKVCFNPRIITVSEETNVLDEGCLSFPNLFVEVRRPARIKVRYQDVTGETFTEHFMGMTARVFLHEFDHMQGTLFTSRAHRVHLERAKREQTKLNRQLKKLSKIGKTNNITITKD